MSWSGTSHEVTRSAPFQLLARAGLVTYGVVHLLVAWLAVRVALGNSGKADKTGALQAVGASGGGTVLLWLVTVGLGATALWQLLEAVLGPRRDRADRRLRAMNVGEAVLFGYLAYSAGKLAGGSAASSTDQAQRGLVGSLLAESWGKPVVIAIGVAVVAAAVFIARHGLMRRFGREQDLSGAGPGLRTAVTRLGQVGYTALGAVYGGAGVLVVVAAVRADPARATGLDVALKTLATQPYGAVLLLLVAAGLAAFAAFCLLDARFRRTG